MPKKTERPTIELAYAIGQPVEVGADEKELVKAKVIGILIQQDGVSYHCAWVNSGERKTAYFTPFEIRTRKSPNAPMIGFNHHNGG
jgi:hypothetical protein